MLPTTVTSGSRSGLFLIFETFGAMQDLNRRRFLMALLLATCFVGDPAFAKDGDSGGGGGGGGSDNSRSGSDDNDDSDEDSDRDKDDRDEDREEDEDADDDNTSNKGRRVKGEEQDRALEAVKKGKAVSLSKLRAYLSEKHPGKILNVSLYRKSGQYFYRVRILSPNNRIKSMSLNALTLKAGTS
jgi:uncharacterized membrane protein YkoI